MPLIALSASFAGLAAGAQEPPVIRVDTRLVPVDVVVRNGKGPVTGLNKDDFTLFDNGKRQEIALFKVSDVRGSQPPATPLPPGMVSNRFDLTGAPTGAADRVRIAVEDQTGATGSVWIPLASN